MKSEEVVELIRTGIPDARVFIEGADCSFSVTVVSEAFAALNSFKKQQMVLATVSEQLKTGALHAMSVKAMTPEEWQNQLVSL